MMPDRNQRHDAGRTSTSHTGWVFIAITIVMASLTLSLPYVVSRIRSAPARGVTGSAPTVPAVR